MTDERGSVMTLMMFANEIFRKQREAKCVDNLKLFLLFLVGGGGLKVHNANVREFSGMEENA